MQKDNHTLYNPKNERIKYKYRIHVRRQGRKDEKTVISALKHIRGYEIFTDFAGFETFCEETADKYITDMVNKNLSLSYMDENLRALKDFLSWLERQRGYRSKISYNHIDYLNLSNNQRRTAKAPEYQKSYKYEQILKTIRLMPENTVIQKRDKAIISLQALCGLRISELKTVKIKSLIEEDGKYFIYVSPKSMSVKRAKTRHADFLPLPDDIKNAVLNWRDYLIAQGFDGKDPLFPQIPSNFNQYNLLESKLTRNEIKSDTTIRDVFKGAFTAAGFEYIKPHNFRHTIVRYAGKHTPELLNAIRQSIGHKSVDTTMQSYGDLSVHEQRERIASLKCEFE